MKITTRLRIEFVAIVVLALAIAGAFECGLLTTGTVDPASSSAYWWAIVDVALTLVMVPLALKLMSLRNVAARVETSDTAFRRWSEVRIAMLATPLLLNIVHYYALGCQPTHAYMALMIAVALLFVWPR